MKTDNIIEILDSIYQSYYKLLENKLEHFKNAIDTSDLMYDFQAPKNNIFELSNNILGSSGSEEIINNFETLYAEIKSNIIKESTEYAQIIFKDISEELIDFEKYSKVKNTDFLNVGFYGRTQVGKSTLLEAILKTQLGNLIGKGTQHFTKSINTYEWIDGVTIFDIPGIDGVDIREVGQAKQMENIAREAVNYIDLFFFIFPADSQQERPLQELKALIELGKPVIVILNIRDAITNEIELNRFSESKKGNFFDPKTIGQHHQRIQKFLRDNGLQEVKIINISALAACIAQFASRSFQNTSLADNIQHEKIKEVVKLFIDKYDSEKANELFQLSNLPTIEKIIIDELKNRKIARKIASIYNRIICAFDNRKQIIHQRIKEFQQIQEGEKKQLKLITESLEKLGSYCKSVLVKYINKAFQSYIDNEYGLRKDIENYLKKPKELEKKITDNLGEKLESELKTAFDEISVEFQKTFEMLQQEIEANAKQFGQNFKFQGADFKYSQGHGWGNFFGNAAFTASTFATIAVLLRAFSLGNFWNPVGWITGVVSTILGIFAWLWSEDKATIRQKAFNAISEELNKAKSSLLYQISYKLEDTMIKPYQFLFEFPINYKILFFDLLIKELEIFEEYFVKAIKELNEDLFIHLFQLQNIPLAKSDILELHRKVGIITKIVVPDTFAINYEVDALKDLLLMESIYLLKISQDMDTFIEEAIYPIIPKSIIIQDDIIVIKVRKDGLLYSEKQIDIYKEIAEKIIKKVITIKFI